MTRNQQPVVDEIKDMKKTNEAENQIYQEPSLWSRPRCQTLSNALEISQNTARTSLPSSRALQTSLYKNVSWLMVESPLEKPDLRGDTKSLLTR